MTELLLILAATLARDDRPPLADLHRFPPLCVIDAQIAANRDYHAYLLRRRAVELDRAAELHAALDQAHFSWWAWDWLRHAALHHGQASDYSRKALLELRQWIGQEAYYAGRMPAAVPERVATEFR